MFPMNETGDDHSRRAILDAALAILTEHGHHALTVRRVAAAAGCSTIGVYTWFGGKDGLVDALWIEAFESFGVSLKRARPADGPLGPLVGQARAYRRWALAHPAHYQLMFFNVIPDHTPSPEAATAAAGAYASLLEAIEHAREHGEIGNADVGTVAHICWAMVHGLVTLQLTNSGPAGVTDSAGANSRAFDAALKALVTGLTLG
jgi:AcrR family transcriptional regulator